MLLRCESLEQPMSLGDHSRRLDRQEPRHLWTAMEIVAQAGEVGHTINLRSAGPLPPRGLERRAWEPLRPLVTRQESAATTG